MTGNSLPPPLRRDAVKFVGTRGDDTRAGKSSPTGRPRELQRGALTCPREQRRRPECGRVNGVIYPAAAVKESGRPA